MSCQRRLYSTDIATAMMGNTFYLMGHGDAGGSPRRSNKMRCVLARRLFCLGGLGLGVSWSCEFLQTVSSSRRYSGSRSCPYSTLRMQQTPAAPLQGVKDWSVLWQPKACMSVPSALIKLQQHGWPPPTLQNMRHACASCREAARAAEACLLMASSGVGKLKFVCLCGMPAWLTHTHWWCHFWPPSLHVSVQCSDMVKSVCRTYVQTGVTLQILHMQAAEGGFAKMRGHSGC